VRGCVRRGAVELEHRAQIAGLRLGGNSTPTVTEVHTWLEAAVVGHTVRGLDMMSFGPQIEASQSPNERVSTPTVGRFWRRSPVSSTSFGPRERQQRHPPRRRPDADLASGKTIVSRL
jgi:hypothetical protein